MPPDEFRALVVSGSANAQSATLAVMKITAERLAKSGARVDFLDLAATPLPIFNPDTAYVRPDYADLKQRVEAADALVLGTPDYHGSISSVLKNFPVAVLYHGGPAAESPTLEETTDVTAIQDGA